MDQNIRVMITGNSPTRISKMITPLEEADIITVELSSFASRMQANSEAIPDLFVLALSQEWENDIKIFLSVFDKSLPSVVVIGPGHNPDLMRRAMQAGAKDYLNDDASESEIRASVNQQLDTIRGNRVATENQMIVSISPMGSSGSAFLMSNLACINAKLGDWRTVALDLDFQFGSLPFYLDLTLERSLFQALDTIDGMDTSSLEAYLTIHNSGLFVGGAFENDMVLPGEVTVESMNQLLKVVNSSFERVFINLPLQINPLTSLVLARADKVVVIVEQDMICLRNSKSLMTVLKNDIEIPGRDINIVINRHNKRHQITSGDVEKAFGGVTTYIIPDDSPRVRNSINTGEPLYKSAPNSAVTKSLLKVAEGLNDGKFKRRPGLFGKAYSYITKH